MAGHTFGVDPVGVQVRQGCLVTELFKGFRRLLIDLKDATRPPSTATFIRHCAVGTLATRCVGPGLVRDGLMEKNWGRQFGGIDSEQSLFSNNILQPGHEAFEGKYRTQGAYVDRCIRRLVGLV